MFKTCLNKQFSNEKKQKKANEKKQKKEIKLKQLTNPFLLLH